VTVSFRGLGGSEIRVMAARVARVSEGSGEESGMGVRAGSAFRSP
jgi:hypothetical protein